MRLRDAVNRLSPEAIERLQVSPIWKNAAEAWPEAATQPDDLAAADSQLTSWGRRLLHYWIRAIGPVPIQEESLWNRSASESGLARAEMKAAIHELCSCGIVYAIRKSWGERLLILPSDCYLAWRATLAEGDPWTELTGQTDRMAANSDKAGGLLAGGGPAEPLPAPGVPLARRLLRAYAALDRLGLARTARGVLPKKTVDTVMCLIDLSPAASLGRLRPVHQDAYPVPFAIALDLAAKLGIITAQDDGFHWSKTGLDSWLQGEDRVREAELAQLVTMLYGCRTPKDAMFASGLLLLEPNCLYEAGGETMLDAEHADWMKLMHTCGWAHYEAASDGAFSFRWLIDPRLGRSAALLSPDTEPAIVLPDGEIIVPPNATFAVRWQLEHIAQWMRDDVVTIYRITAQSVVSAVERGMKQDELLNAVRSAACGSELPEELVHAVQHWAGSACRTSIEEVVLLRCETREIADAITHRPEISGLLAERIGDRAFIVRAEDTAKVRKELERAGWPPLRQAEVGGRIAEPEEAASSASMKKKRTAANRTNAASVQLDFIYNENAVDRYELLMPQPYETADLTGQLMPDWPSSWTAQLRSYHHSTRRQIIESALEWGVPIQLMAGGQPVELLPERLEGAAEPWLVSGYVRRNSECEPVRLTPDMWDEMRIVIPRLTKDTAGM